MGFQASVAMLMRSPLFWDITRRRKVIVYLRPETSVTNYQTTQRNIPEERKYQGYGIFKKRKLSICKQFLYALV
jgi:hypothetical protein